MKILSLFDWISCWQQAITNLWITDYTYYSSEIDKYAIQVTQHNFPNTIQIWDVKSIQFEKCNYFWCNSSWDRVYEGWYNYCKYLWYNYCKGCWRPIIQANIDLLLWWSPCQWFSFAWKQLNFEDERSKLFFEYVRILKEVKPKYFLLENVRMKKEYQDIISEHLFWIQPTTINSSLLTAQNRVRLYWVWELQEDWTYKQVEIEQPEDRGILLKDILEDEVDEKYYLDTKQYKWLKDFWSKSSFWWKINRDKANCLLASYWKVSWNWWKIKDNKWIRMFTPIECERLQWVRDWYTAWVSNSQRYKMLGNWWTVPVIEHILKHLNLNK